MFREFFQEQTILRKQSERRKHLMKKFETLKAVKGEVESRRVYQEGRNVVIMRAA